MHLRKDGAWPIRHVLVALSLVALLVAAVAAPGATAAAARQTWPPFVLVAGLLMIGAVANQDGLFAALAAGSARLRTHPSVLLLALLGVVAGVTAVLNLDTSVAFLTPVLVLAARARGVDEEPFLYGTLLMSNSASLLLPGSNLTNLLVRGREPVAGAVFATRMAPAWTAAVVVTALFIVVVYRRRLGADDPPVATQPAPVPEPRPLTIGWSTAAVVAAALALLALRSPAPAVVVIGLGVAAVEVRKGTISAAAVREAVDAGSLIGVFALAVVLGAVARGWSGPAHLVATAGRAETAIVGAVAAITLNNLPAAVLLGSRVPRHPGALLLGLNLGPNLAVTGSLSALIWFRSARAVGARPSAARLTRLGVVLVPLTLAAALLAQSLFSSGSG